MIKILKYSEIDFEKYSKCIENACQNSDYAARDFLDVVSNRKWFLLVYKDYEAIMPVSYIRKYGFTFVLMPKICQQLGVFSLKDQPEINALFYDFLNRKFSVLVYAFNKQNQFKRKVQKGTSYILEKNSYPEIKKKFSVNRRRNVRVVGDLVDNIEIRKKIIPTDSEFFSRNLKGTKNLKNNQEYFNLMAELLAKNIGELSILEFKNEIKSLIYLYEGKKVRYLSLFVNEYPVTNSNLPSIAIDQCLQQYVEDKSFDFMGSGIENIAKFNERFGATSYHYSILKQTKLTLFKNLWKSKRIITKFALS